MMEVICSLNSLLGEGCDGLCGSREGFVRDAGSIEPLPTPSRGRESHVSLLLDLILPNYRPYC